MAHELRITKIAMGETKWGQANPQRGRNFIDDAIAFQQRFPLGSEFSEEDFDQWAKEHGHYTPPGDVDKQSDAWLANIQRRYHLKTNLNKASTHPRMRELGGNPYYIKAQRGGGGYRVQTLEESIAHHDILLRIASLMVSKKKHLGYLLQAHPWDQLPAYELTFAESLYEDIDGLQENFTMQAQRLNGKLDRLTAKLQASLPSPRPVPQLLAPPSTDKGSERKQEKRRK